MRKWKRIITTILGVILGYAIHYYVFSEIITRFVAIDSVAYKPALILSLCFCIIGNIIILYAIFNKEIIKITLVIAYITYYLLIFIMIFGRYTIERMYIFNPIISISELTNGEMILQTILNIGCFVPLGYLFKDIKKRKMIILSISLSLILETLQVITMRGIFDTFDIILYTIGICIGYSLAQRMKVKLK